MELSVLSDAIDELAACDPALWADTASITELIRLRARVDALVSAAVAAFEAEGAWAPCGAKTAAAWLKKDCRLPGSEAKALVRRGRVVRSRSELAVAWSGGRLGAAQVEVLSHLHTPATAEAFDRDIDMLIDQAARLPFSDFEKVAAYWLQMADPDGADGADEERRSRRHVDLDRTFGGMYVGRLVLDPISGDIVARELERLERLFFQADWAEAKGHLGRDPLLSELARDPGQRRADALVEMATRSQTLTAGEGRDPAPLLTILVGWETLHGRVCELANGTVLAPGSLLPWLDRAYLERVVFAPPDRTQVSHTTRLFTGATRRAIEVRDRQCVHPYCDVPAADCQGDHIIPFAYGGATVQENGQMLCGFHNRLRIGKAPPGD
jgi:uncharacterized protein DUF222